MKEYNTKELKDLIQINSDKKKTILMNWIESEVMLYFNLTENQQIIGILKFFTRYDYIIQIQNQETLKFQNTISILAKHAVLWIDRV